MKKALETRPVLAPDQCISDAVLQIAEKPFEKKVIKTLFIQACQQGKCLKMQPVETVVLLSPASPACQTCKEWARTPGLVVKLSDIKPC